METKIKNPVIEKWGQKYQIFPSDITHKRFNSIDSLDIEGNTATDQEQIKEAIQNFYQKLYRETEDWRPTFNLPGNVTIDMEEQEWLQRNFEEEEVV